MTDVLVITGPINRTQAGVEIFAPGTKVLDVQLGNGQVRSFHYASAMQSFLGGKSLRSVVEAKVGPVDRLGVLWFSAGHGGINVALQTTDPSEVDAWLCLDGLYAGWKHQTQWATRLAQAAMEGSTTCVATASTTTPGQYADGLTSWRNVVVPLEVPEVSPPEPFPPFPVAAEMWRDGSFLLLGYPDIPHWEQTPAVREGMMRVWTSGLPRVDPQEPSTPPGPPITPTDEPSPWTGAAWVGGTAAAALLAAAAGWRLWQSRYK